MLRRSRAVAVAFALVLAGLIAGCASARQRAAVSTTGATRARGATSPVTPVHSVTPASVTVSSRLASSPPLAADFIGISLEVQAVPQFAGTDPEHPDPVLIALLRNLVPGGSPVLRIGGNSTDDSWWPVPGVKKPPGVSYSLTPQWMAITKSLATALGGKLILGLNWAAHNSKIAIAEAQTYVSQIGTNLIGELELGNEPGYYGHLPWYFSKSGEKVRSRPESYGLADFLREYQGIVPKLPNVPMAGPGDGNLPGVAPEQDFVAHAPRLKLVSMHRYPLIACQTDPAKPTYPSTSHLLSRVASEGLADGIVPYVDAAHAAHLPYRLDEINSVSCRGAAVSRTFASTLWVLDQLFQLARIGVAGVNFNTFQNALYEPFGVTEIDGRWSAQVAPMYYGMLMFTQAAPPGSRLLSLAAQHTGALRAYAVQTPSDTVNVVVINDSLTTTRSMSVSVAGHSQPAFLTRLSAPSVTATSGVTIGGRSIAPNTSTGQLIGHQVLTKVAPTSAAGYRFSLPPASAAMLTLPLSSAALALQTAP